MFNDRIEQVDTARTKPSKIEVQLTARGQYGWELVSVAPEVGGEHILKAFLKHRAAARASI